MRQGWSRFSARSSLRAWWTFWLWVEQVKYTIHPGVAQAGQAEVDEKFRAAVDSMMASFWRALFDQAQSGEAEGMGQLVITAGLRSAPYLIRQKEWS